MRVLIDCPIWSMAFRRAAGDLHPRERRLVEEWKRLVRSGRAVINGPIRQEVLTGIRHPAQFERLRVLLEAFEDEPLDAEDFVEAARFFNRARAGGVSGTAIDLLLCAFAHRRGLALFTTDADFERYARFVPVRLHAAG